MFSSLVAGAMLAMSPAGSAQDQAPTQGDITIACVHGCVGVP